MPKKLSNNHIIPLKWRISIALSTVLGAGKDYIGKGGFV